jgi:hypothetical protein
MKSISYTRGRVAFLLLIIISAAAAAAAAAASASAPEPCGPPSALSAYAHNDYRNPHPCADALALGYLGVEADVFFRDGVFLLAHARKEARPGFDFESTYLRPLLSRAQRCGRVQPDPRPFVITIEDKAPTPESRAAMATLLGHYRDLLDSSAEGPIARFILVDDSAAPATVSGALKQVAGLQWRVTDGHPAPPEAEAHKYALLSIDYGEVIEWDGTGAPPTDVRRLLAAVVEAAHGVPGCLVRVHHVPERRRIWEFLLKAGVDRIGVTDLAQGAALLMH